MPSERGDNPGDTPVPDYVQKYLDGLRKEGTKHSVRAELDAYARMQSDIDREKRPDLKQFMHDTVVHYCTEGMPLLSYIYKSYWHELIKEQKALGKKAQPLRLFIALESILASQSDSSGYTKTASYSRYPLVIPGFHSGKRKVRHVPSDLAPAQLLKAYYEFGVHRFYVGYAIRNILDHLEGRYGLDFKELERLHQRAAKR